MRSSRSQMATPGSKRPGDAAGDVKTETPSRRANQVASAEKQLENALGAEGELRDRLTSLSQHQEKRRQAIADTAPRRKELESTLAQFDAALEHTRPERVRAHAEDPPPYLVRLLGLAPSSPAGQAVWCHHALCIEAFVDRNDEVSPPSTGWSRQADRARQEITIADRLLETSDHAGDPTEWAKLAGQADTLRKEAHRQVIAQRALESRMSPFPQKQWSPGIDNSAAPGGPELSL